MHILELELGVWLHFTFDLGLPEAEVGTQERSCGTEHVASFLVVRQESAFSGLLDGFWW